MSRPLRLALCLGCLLAAAEVFAITHDFDREHLPTKIEGIPVDLYVSGPVDFTLGGGAIEGTFDVELDLSDFQQKLGRILTAKASLPACGQETLSLRNAAVAPEVDGAITQAEVTAVAVWRKRTCSDKARTETIEGPVRIRVRPRVAAAKLLFDTTVLAEGDAISPARADAVAAQLASSFGAATSTSTIVAPVSADTNALDPHVHAAAFVALPNGALGARLSVTLTLTLGLIMNWIGGGD